MSNILQNQLATDELPRWTALANGDTSVSDAGLNELELSTTNVGRHSCPPQTRESFFACSTEYLLSFLCNLDAAACARNRGAPTAWAATVTSDQAEAIYAPQVQLHMPRRSLQAPHSSLRASDSTRRLECGYARRRECS